MGFESLGIIKSQSRIGAISQPIHHELEMVRTNAKKREWCPYPNA